MVVLDTPDQLAARAISLAFALARKRSPDAPLLKLADDEMWNQPTDILGFDAVGQALARQLEPLVGLKEICYYDPAQDPDLHHDPAPHDAHFHYWPFQGMLEKSEFMFINLPATPDNLALFDDLSRFNHNMKVIIISNGFEEVTKRLVEKCERGELGGVASVPQNHVLSHSLV